MICSKFLVIINMVMFTLTTLNKNILYLVIFINNKCHHCKILRVIHKINKSQPINKIKIEQIQNKIK